MPQLKKPQKPAGTQKVLGRWQYFIPFRAKVVSVPENIEVPIKVAIMALSIESCTFIEKDYYKSAPSTSHYQTPVY